MLQTLANVLGKLKEIILQNNFTTPQGEMLWKEACSFLGKDASPADRAPDEYGCADSVNMIYRAAFGKEIGGTVSTARLYEALHNSSGFLKVYTPRRGDIIISPTGFGNGTLPNGHVGIMSNGDVIMSNDSFSGQWRSNYTLDTWKARYLVRGGYPIYYYRVIVY